MKKRGLKKPPTLRSDAEAEEFVDTADLSEYDFSEMVPMRDFLASFELKPKDEQVNLRLSSELLNAVKETAAANNMPYQRFIRIALERAVHEQRRAPRR
jgi:predicted DNA binding CopG/RHH family protein